MLNKDAKMDRREFLKLLGGSLVLVSFPEFIAACSMSSEEKKPEKNLVKAKELLTEVGIGENFSTSQPETMYRTSLKLANNPEFDNKLWKIFINTKGETLGLALNKEGEAVPLINGPDNKPQSIQGLNFEFSDPAQPTLVYEVTEKNAKNESVKYRIVGYTDASKLQAILQRNRNEIPTFLKALFAHSTSHLNLLHLPNDGMPVHIFNPTDTQNPAFLIDESNLPSKDLRGAARIRYETDTGRPTRNDIYISPKHIRKEAELIGMPAHSVLAGYLANEAYGVAVDTYRLPRHLEQPAGRYEAGSTGADWATMFLVAQDSPNPFFSKYQVDLIKQLSNL